MNDLEKSVELLKLIGCTIKSVKRNSGAWHRVLVDKKGNEIKPTIMFGGGTQPRPMELEPRKCINLYDPSNFHLATMVVRWADQTLFKNNNDEYRWLFIYKFVCESTRTALDNIFVLSIALDSD